MVPVRRPGGAVADDPVVRTAYGIAGVTACGTNARPGWWHAGGILLHELMTRGGGWQRGEAHSLRHADDRETLPIPWSSPQPRPARMFGWHSALHRAAVSTAVRLRCVVVDGCRLVPCFALADADGRSAVAGHGVSRFRLLLDHHGWLLLDHRCVADHVVQARPPVSLELMPDAVLLGCVSRV